MVTASILREARLRAGLTQAELGKRAGTTQSSIARWETGRSRPPLETLMRLVRACGLELQIELGTTDPSEVSLLERTLALSPAERLDQLVRAVRFIGEGRAALARSLG